jgi:hypothetical protein
MKLVERATGQVFERGWRNKLGHVVALVLDRRRPARCYAILASASYMLCGWRRDGPAGLVHVQRKLTEATGLGRAWHGRSRCLNLPLPRLQARHVLRLSKDLCIQVGLNDVAEIDGQGAFAWPNVRVEAGPTARRQARAGENVLRTTGPGLVACRWASPRTRG